MTDLDDELRRAGQRWRADADSRAAALNVNTSISSMGTRSPGPGPLRRWAPATAAALVVGVVVATVVVLQPGHFSHRTKPGDPYALPTDVRSMAVHDGDRVRAIGEVFDSTGGPLLCTHVGSASVQIVAGPSRLSSNPCGGDVIARLTGTGFPADGDEAELTGVFRDGTIAVEQITSTSNDFAFAGVASESFQTPCPAPAGGWNSPTGNNDYPDDAQLAAYIDRHRDLIGAEWESTPDPKHQVPYSGGGTTALQIMAIGVAGGTDVVNQVRADLASKYKGELCIYPVPSSYSQQDAIGRKAAAILGSALIQPGHDEQRGVEYAEVKLLDAGQAARLAALGNVIVVYPHVWPVK